MFKKKNKKNTPLPVYDYTKWETDFGFLVLIMNRKINTAKEYNIKPFRKQLQKPSDYIRDEDIQEEYQNIVEDIYDTLSEAYKQFLISKYFKNEKKLIEFISENVYDDLVRSSIEENNKKISHQYSDKMVDKISKMNQMVNAKKEK